MRLSKAFPIMLVLALACGPSSPRQTTRPDEGLASKGDTADKAPDPRALLVNDLAALRFERLGDPVRRWDHIPPVTASPERPHRLLVLLVEFPDRGFDRFRGQRDQASKLAAWYQEQLFDEGYARKDTLSHYYATQSLGAYHVTGQVLPPIKLSKKRAAYGAPHRPAGGDWRNDADPESLVEEAVNLAMKQHPHLPWADYDRWDPLDFDGDKVLDEPDGYIDHFVLVYAGGGQSSCQLLQRLGTTLTPNVGMEALGKLNAKQRECANRIWPHRARVERREAEGPTIAERQNRLGGAPLSPALWIRDYNMQSEYTDISTFIHEFGHSIGLPDVYSRTSSNSTGGWEVMSGTASPSPQNLSAWSRIMLGWLKPRVIMPPSHGGAGNQIAYLRTLDDPAAARSGADRALMVVLPPKTLKLELTKLPARAGTSALYSGQGNELNRTAELRVDLTKIEADAIELSFDAWWEIEGGWDFAYVETSIDEGRTWTRRLPRDRAHMPAKHGHDGKDTLPGFTGLSGDLDGDGKNESNPACDAKVELAHGEDQAGQEKSPCLIPTWVRPSFDLSDLGGSRARIRLRYYTDLAAVMRGVLIDNVTLTGVTVDGDFEDADMPGWHIDGFARSPGRHELLVPHYYLLEYRDPYAGPEDAYRYDSALARPVYRFYYDAAGKTMNAVEVRTRPGLVAWYYNGEYAWSENDPAINGPGKGYLLALDANPNEIPLPGMEQWLRGTAEARDTRYDVSSEEAQSLLRDAYHATLCFVRNPAYLPPDLPPKVARALGCGKRAAPISALTVNGRRLVYAYEISNDLLPGKSREAVESASELIDIRTRGDKTSYRLRDRALRHDHTSDAPFALEAFAEGLVFYQVKDGKLVKTGSRDYPAQKSFSDSPAGRWLNPELMFGGADLPDQGLSFELKAPGPDAPEGARVKVVLTWQKRP